MNLPLSASIAPHAPEAGAGLPPEKWLFARFGGSGCKEEPSSEEIEVGAAVHGALQELETLSDVTAKLLLPDLPWAAAVALGAIVAPPDAVAAASVRRTSASPSVCSTS